MHANANFIGAGLVVYTSHAAFFGTSACFNSVFKSVMSMEDLIMSEAPTQGAPDDVACLHAVLEEPWPPLPSMPASQQSPDPAVEFMSASLAEQSILDALTPIMPFAQPDQRVAMSEGSASPPIEPCANSVVVVVQSPLWIPAPTAPES